MIQVESTYPLEQVESAICRAAQRYGARVIAVTPFGSLMSEDAPSAPERAICYTVCHTEIYNTVLRADIRFAAFLPCRIAAERTGDGLLIETISPASFCALLGRGDLESVVEPLDQLLCNIMQEMAKIPAIPPRRARAAASLLGAREGQGSMSGSIAQRIDGHGTKIEDLAGTGKVDAPGG